VRLQVRAEDELVLWLTHVQGKHFEMAQHQYTSPQRVQQWSNVPWRLRLFDSLVVFQNYALDEAAERLGASVVVRAVSAPEGTNYPLALTVTPGPELLIRLIYDRQRLDAAPFCRCLGHRDRPRIYAAVFDEATFGPARAAAVDHEGKAARIRHRNGSAWTKISLTWAAIRSCGRRQQTSGICRRRAARCALFQYPTSARWRDISATSKTVTPAIRMSAIVRDSR